jgi:hypothetical protein
MQASSPHLDRHGFGRRAGGAPVAHPRLGLPARGSVPRPGHRGARYPTQAAQQSTPQQTREKSGGLAISSLILGIIALFLSWIPIVNYLAVILGVIGLVLGAIGIFKSKRVMSIFGTALSVLSIIIAFTVFGAFAAAVDEELGGGAGDSSGAAEVVYTIESDAPSVSATYATADSSGIGQQQDNGVTPPWTTTVQVDRDWLSGQAFVLTGSMEPVLDGSSPDGTTITCHIQVDGEVVAEQTSTGQYAIVTCTASDY